MNKKMSIIIPCLNEENYIGGCLDSILKADIDYKDIEIIIVDGISNDKTIDIVQSYQEEYNFIKILQNPKKIVPISMNLAIKVAKGDYIVRLDAHSEYPIDYFSKLLNWSNKLDADNVGAVCLTGSKSDTLVAKSIRFVMSDKFGVGNSLFRTGTKEVIEVDTVPFGFYKREVFHKIGLYDERLVRVQDLELNKRLKASGGKIYLVPDVYCTYYPRETYLSFFKNRFQTGKWVILASYLTNNIKSISLRHLVPGIFVILMMLLAIFNLKLFIALLGVYSVILCLRSLVLKKSLLLIIFNLVTYLLLHFSYGIGSIMGIFSIIKIKYFKYK